MSHEGVPNLILMCACCVLWCCIICPKCGKILGAGLAWLSAAPPPSFLKFVDKLKISGAHSAVNIRQTQPDTLNIPHHSVQTASKRTSRYFLFFLAAANCRSICTISLAFLQSKYTAARGKCPKKEAWKLFSEMLLLWWQLVRKKEVIAGDFSKQCYVCMFVWPSSPTSIKYNIQYSVRHGVVRLCGYCVYCEAEMAAGECPLQILDIIPQTPNTKHTICWTLRPRKYSAVPSIFSRN